MAIITKITRTYSKSINMATYGRPESWVKISSTVEAEIESNDDPAAVSQTLAETVQKEVIGTVKVIVDKINAAPATAPVAAQGAAPVVPAAALPTEPKAL